MGKPGGIPLVKTGGKWRKLWVWVPDEEPEEDEKKEEEMKKKLEVEEKREGGGGSSGVEMEEGERKEKENEDVEKKEEAEDAGNKKKGFRLPQRLPLPSKAKKPLPKAMPRQGAFGSGKGKLTGITAVVSTISTIRPWGPSLNFKGKKGC